MYKTIEFIKKSNKGFKYYLFDDNECRKFIEKKFDKDVLNAYDSLIPGAYKADLWRYCILYKYGGVYLDIKYIPIQGFKFIHLLEQEHFPLDLNKNDIYNALLVCKPKNEILLKAINQIVWNVQNKYYGEGVLHPTGPALLGNLLTSEEKTQAKIHHSLTGSNDYDKLLNYEDKVILRCYPGYFIERAKYSKIQHYSNLWNQRKIYK
jgi:mannosyltransferase OCH1-like enzyme